MRSFGLPTLRMSAGTFSLAQLYIKGLLKKRYSFMHIILLTKSYPHNYTALYE